ncbi:MAG: HAD family hydrolase [Spirochaetia bacterium]
MIRGVILDMDGVLLDSEEFIAEAAIKMFKEKGKDVKREDFKPFIGAGEDRYLQGAAEKYNVTLDLDRDKARTYEIYGELIKGRLDPLPGVNYFVRKCKENGLKLGLATSADRIKMEANLHEINLPEDTFDVVITGLDVIRKKPYPDIYLRSAVLMGLSPTQCLVVEDAVNGVEAAKKAGARCLGLTTSFKAEELHEADWIAPDLAQFPEEALTW